MKFGDVFRIGASIARPEPASNAETAEPPSGEIVWRTERRPLSSLAEWSGNPRRLGEHDAKALEESLRKFGLADPLVANADGVIIGGHQRKRVLALARLRGPDDLVDVRVPSRQLTDDERVELAIRLNRNVGEWDWDMLANEFEQEKLYEWGFRPEDFAVSPEAPTDESASEPSAALVECPKCGFKFQREGKG